MEKTIKKRELSYTALFNRIGVGNCLHVPLGMYSKAAIQTECTRQNKYAGCNSMDNKFTTSTRVKKGYLTIYQRK